MLVGAAEEAEEGEAGDRVLAGRGSEPRQGITEKPWEVQGDPVRWESTSSLQAPILLRGPRGLAAAPQCPLPVPRTSSFSILPRHTDLPIPPATSRPLLCNQFRLDPLMTGSFLLFDLSTEALIRRPSHTIPAEIAMHP